MEPQPIQHEYIDVSHHKSKDRHLLIYAYQVLLNNIKQDTNNIGLCLRIRYTYLPGINSIGRAKLKNHFCSIKRPIDTNKGGQYYWDISNQIRRQKFIEDIIYNLEQHESN